MLNKFQNEPFTDFNSQDNRQKMVDALTIVEDQKGMHYQIIINVERIDTCNRIISRNPSCYKEIVGTTASADIEIAEKAIESSGNAFRKWQYVNAEERSCYIFKAASVLRRRKFEFSAWLIEEAGKSWAEADADVAEAIDFLEYYGRQMLHYSKGVSLTCISGEINSCNYIPLGVGVVISPWNFPLAILAGMTAAAVVTGNTVIIKPASSTPVIAAKFMEIWDEVCLPPGVINYLPGPGGILGDYLVGHPKIRFINFTGSRDIGVRINSIASKMTVGQKWIKRVVAEMGGKDAIIVDNEAALEDAAEGIVSSAFGFQGQKCSACSRAIILEDVYEEVLSMIIDKIKEIKVGAAKDPTIDMGPVIDENAYNKILKYIELGKREGKLTTNEDMPNSEGYFIPPAVFRDVPYDARIAQEEIFGPVLACIKAADFDDAVRIANSTEYGLTGAVYSRNREKLQKAKKEFHVGNLYLNRKCTGALVGVHPFGGFNMSGTDSKAGGPDYLLQFMQAKAVSEKL